MMYGQMTAGTWIYIGRRELCRERSRRSRRWEKHFGGDLAGKLIVSGGMGGMGGAQPLAATMAGAAFLGIDVDPERIKRRVKTGYCDFMVTPGRGVAHPEKCGAQERECFGRAGRELCGHYSGAGRARRCAGRADGSDRRTIR